MSQIYYVEGTGPPYRCVLELPDGRKFYNKNEFPSELDALNFINWFVRDTYRAISLHGGLRDKLEEPPRG